MKKNINHLKPQNINTPEEIRAEIKKFRDARLEQEQQEEQQEEQNNVIFK